MTDNNTSTAKGPKAVAVEPPVVPAVATIGQEPQTAGTAATFDLGAAYAAAEQEESRLVAAIEDRKRTITTARAGITADEAKLKDVRRFLSSRTPRKVNRAAK